MRAPSPRRARRRPPGSTAASGRRARRASAPARPSAAGTRRRSSRPRPASRGRGSASRTCPASKWSSASSYQRAASRIAAGEVARVAEAERRVARGLVVVGARASRSVRPCTRPGPGVLARFERDQPPDAERERVAWSRSGTRAAGAAPVPRLPRLPEVEQRDGEAPLAIARVAASVSGSASRPAASRPPPRSSLGGGVDEPQRQQPPLPRRIGRPGRARVEQRARLGSRYRPQKSTSTRCWRYSSPRRRRPRRRLDDASTASASSKRLRSVWARASSSAAGKPRAVGAAPARRAARRASGSPASVRRPRRVDQQVGRDRGARVEQQPGDPQRVVGPERLALAASSRPARSRSCRARSDRQLRAHDLAVERMREPHLARRRRAAMTGRATRARRARRSRQAATSSTRSGSPSASSSSAARSRSASPAIRRETSSASEAAHRRTARQPPQPAGARERAAVDGGRDELAHVQRVALAGVEDPAQRRLLDRTVERGLDQHPDRLVAQPPQLHPPRAGVLPQRHDRVRARVPGAHGREHERGAGLREVQDERGRHGIEQLRVVDAEHDRRPPARSSSTSALCRIRSSVSSDRASSGISPANAPSGTAAALLVACTQPTSAPSRSAAACASRARRDLPTPAAALSTTPRHAASPRADAMSPSSISRPVSGHTPLATELGADPPSTREL